MTNSYEVPEVIVLGSIEKEILGSKRMANQVESIFGTGWYAYVLPDDIDESDDMS